MKDYIHTTKVAVYEDPSHEGKLPPLYVYQVLVTEIDTSRVESIDKIDISVDHTLKEIHKEEKIEG